MKTPVYHVTGCGEIAFYFMVEPYDGMALTSDIVEYDDGSQPPEDPTQALCGTCFDPLEVDDLTTKRLVPQEDW